MYDCTMRLPQVKFIEIIGSWEVCLYDFVFTNFVIDKHREIICLLHRYPRFIHGALSNMSNELFQV